MDREQNRIPMQIAPGKKITLSPGEHSELIRAIVEEFGPRFAPGSVLVYAGDTGDKWGYFDAVLLAKLGVDVDSHGKMPDVVLYFAEKNWLLLIESVTSHGPVDGKRHAELTQLVRRINCRTGLCDCIPKPLDYGTIFKRNRMGNRSVGGGCAIASYSF